MADRFLVALRCMGEIDGPRFLGGNPYEGTVRLASNLESYGTNWILNFQPGLEGVSFKCVEDEDGYLERIDDATVGLISDSPGTRWVTRWRYGDNNQVVTFQCVASTGRNLFLDGRTGSETVGFAPGTDGFSGTQWEVIKLANDPF
ncbi:hypothetical protein [Leptolyngbya sp. FACHB-8]|uniref:hypothetical protein n=1 Tax=unclassified Leptolyngbya TaxID=2650499 RepID=UPI0016854001|nr:hypothetical protein [Leptolyngbya sp. FACHB-8]